MDSEVETKPTISKVIRIYKFPIILGGIGLVCIVISVILLVKSIQITTPIQFTQKEASVAGQISTTIQIDIEGAVQNPGLYQLPEGSRIEDAITSAGGLSGEADLAAIAKIINRASLVRDGGKIYIPGKGEIRQEPCKNCATSQSFNKDFSPQSSQLGLVSVNSSSSQALEGLSGIGPVTAKKIIANRPYQTLEELVSSKAMGQSLFDKLKDQLTL